MDMLVLRREELVHVTMMGSHPGNSDLEKIEFWILGAVRRGVIRTATLDSLRTDFGLFKVMVDRVPWQAVLEGKGAQEGWTCSKKESSGHRSRLC